MKGSKKAVTTSRSVYTKVNVRMYILSDILKANYVPNIERKTKQKKNKWKTSSNWDKALGREFSLWF